ncbi:hypothetical protein [Methylobacterium trifolii]|uniref:hypothetical protein n=1 Tax=Methylobacterium trifolii TaxID=1003092 RepID=UPI0035A25116
MNISVEEGLLKRIDRAAEAAGESRSGFLAQGPGRGCPLRPECARTYRSRIASRPPMRCDSPRRINGEVGTACRVTGRSRGPTSASRS